MFWVLGSGWYRREKDNVRTQVNSNNHSTALTNLDKLIASRQAYITNLPTQQERDALAEAQQELEHAKRHIADGILNTDTSQHTVQKQKALEILDRITEV
jgi:hypothetical protein